MNDDQIAETLVEAGVGRRRSDGRYLIAPETQAIREHGPASWFVRNWLVAGAAIDAREEYSVLVKGVAVSLSHPDRGSLFGDLRTQDNIPRAICEAAARSFACE